MEEINISGRNFLILTNEEDLVCKVTSFLKNEKYSVYLEVPTLGRSGDIIAQKNRWITAIEAKMYDSKKVIEQCIVYESLADFICIAWGGITVNKMVHDIAQEKGYGVIIYNRNKYQCEWFLNPKYNNNIWKPQRKIWLEKIKEVKNAC